MKKLLVLLLCISGCGSPNHEQERKDVCSHSEGFADNQCNAGDDFTPLTCLTALDQFECWWRGDAQTAVNDCLISSACFNKADGIPGPSILIPLQFCLGAQLITLHPTDSETQAVQRFCVKAGQCGELGDYTIAGCEEVLLDPYGDGQLFLMMSDQVSANVAACDKSMCADFDSCVTDVLHTSGAFNSINGVDIKMPQLMTH